MEAVAKALLPSGYGTVSIHLSAGKVTHVSTTETHKELDFGVRGIA